MEDITNDKVKKTRRTGKWKKKQKSIVTKKANPQRGIQCFFPTTKAAKEPEEKNFQAKPMSECEFDGDVIDFVYQPSWWGAKTLDEERTVEPPICRTCYLRPCMAVECQEDIFGFAQNCEFFCPGENDNLTIVCKTLRHVESIMVRVFGVRCARRAGIPNCVGDAITERYPLGDDCDVDECPLPDGAVVDDADQGIIVPDSACGAVPGVVCSAAGGEDEPEFYTQAPW